MLWSLLFFLCWSASERTLRAESDVEQLSVSSSTFAPTAFLALLDPSGSNQKCLEDSLHYARAFANRSQWAVTMFGASGKWSDHPHHSIKDNSIYPDVINNEGLFDVCLGSIHEGQDMPDFEAQYCTVYLSAQPLSSDDEVVDGLLKEPKTAEAARQLHPFVPVIPVNMTIDFCLPSSCTAYDLRMAVAQKVGRTIFVRNKDRQRHSLLTITHDRHCHTHKKNNKESAPDWLAYVCYAVIGVIVILAITATIHEAVQGRIASSNSSRKHVHILQCFTVMRNFKKLWETDSSSDHISCLNGIRVISTIGIIVYHVGTEIFRQLLFNKEIMAKVMRNPIYKPASNMSFLVDTFFVIGGLLACTSLLRDLDRGRFNLRRLFFHRYIRLSAAYAVVILLTAGLIGSLGTGPHWYHVKYRSEDCRTYWLTHLIYVNNFIPSHSTYCMFETWYLANDMQMFLLSPLVIYPLWRWKRAGLAWALLLLAACLGANVAIHILYELSPGLMGTRPSDVANVAQYIRIYYYNTFLRYSPYLIGILLGWILHRNKNVKITLNKMTVACGWILSVTALVAILCGLTPYLDEEETPVIDPYFRVLYGSFSRTVWGISIAWIVFACAKGHGGWPNTFLSSKAFVPLAGVSYSAYLVQYGIVTIYVSYSRSPVHLANDFELTIVKVLVVSFFSAFALTIFVEMPLRSLGTIFLGDNKTQTGDAKRLKRQ